MARGRAAPSLPASAGREGPGGGGRGQAAARPARGSPADPGGGGGADRKPSPLPRRPMADLPGTEAGAGSRGDRVHGLRDPERVRPGPAGPTQGGRAPGPLPPGDRPARSHGGSGQLGGHLDDAGGGRGPGVGSPRPAVEPRGKSGPRCGDQPGPQGPLDRRAGDGDGSCHGLGPRPGRRLAGRPADSAELLPARPRGVAARRPGRLRVGAERMDPPLPDRGER